MDAARMSHEATVGADDTPRKDFWLWRLLATGMSFVLFGLGGLLLWGLVFPLQRLLPGETDVRQRRARLVVHYSFRGFIHFLRLSGVLTLDFKNAGHLGNPGQMIIANHPSLLDVVLLIGYLKDANCIVRHGLLQNVFTRGPIVACGYISNDGSLDMLERAAAVLRAGQTLIVFPEGTRTPPAALPRFHRGACAIALRGAQCIMPVVIQMQPRSLTKGEPWYSVPSRRIHYRITPGDAIAVETWRARYPLAMAGRKLNAHLEGYFAAALQPTQAGVQA